MTTSITWIPLCLFFRIRILTPRATAIAKSRDGNAWPERKPSTTTKIPRLFHPILENRTRLREKKDTQGIPDTKSV